MLSVSTKTFAVSIFVGFCVLFAVWHPETSDRTTEQIGGNFHLKASSYQQGRQTGNPEASSPQDRELLFDWLLDWIFGLFFDWTEWKYRRLVPELFYSEARRKPPQKSKAIVIGSGFGGSITALRLGEAGIQTTVLERGQRWPAADRWRDFFTFEPLRDGRGLWHRKFARNPVVVSYTPPLPVDYFGGVLDVIAYDNIEVLRGACVGGGSVVYSGVTIQPRKEYFEEIFGDLVSYEEMTEVYFPRVKEMLDVGPIPDDILQSFAYGKARVWDRQVTNAGYTIERPDMAFQWDIVRDELNGRAIPQTIIGNSNMGISNGAKFDTTQNYLKEAEETGNVRVFPNQQVTDIEEMSGGYKVHIKQFSPMGKVIDRYTIECEYLFLGAGSIGTTELLLKAKEKGLISGLNEEIGKGWGSNGDCIMLRSFNPVEGITQASACSGIIREDSGPNPMTLESWYVPGAPFELTIQAELGIVFDMENRGHFEYDSNSDDVDLVWSSTASNTAAEACIRLQNIVARAEPQSIPGLPLPPLFPPGVSADSTAHPLGGAVLGKATDTYGRVLGTQRLYVMDGAAIPGSTGAVNPALTISGLAERNIEKVIQEDF